MRASLAIAAPLLCGALNATADPLPTRDQNPLLATFGLPVPMDSRIGDEAVWATRMDVNWGSTALLQASEDDILLVDAETFEARWTLQHTLGANFAVQLEIPWRHIGAGRLDGFIDSWHDVFGLPQGARSELPRDELHIIYDSSGARVLDIDDSSSGIGDITVSAGYSLVRTPKGAATAWVSVKLPTGDADDLTGSGAADWSLMLAGERELGQRWITFGQAGVTLLGTSEILAEGQEDWVWSALAGIGWRAWRGLELKLQVDAHTAAYDAPGLDYFDDAVILSVGGAYRSEGGWQFDAGLSEDIVVEGSPDVVFVFGLRRSWH